jgi:hypothetical protein
MIIDTLNENLKILRFYLYAYLDTEKPGFFIVKTSMGDFTFDYSPIYIGKGSENRIEYHQSSCKNKKLKEKIEKGTYKCFIFKKDLDSHFAYALESEIIYKIGREDLNKGPLYNLSSGINLIEADSKSEIGPVHLEVKKLIHKIKVLNSSKTIKIASIKLNVSQRTIYRIIKSNRLKSVDGSWIQEI